MDKLPLTDLLRLPEKLKCAKHYNKQQYNCYYCVECLVEARTIEEIKSLNKDRCVTVEGLTRISVEACDAFNTNAEWTKGKTKFECIAQAVMEYLRKI